MTASAPCSRAGKSIALWASPSPFSRALPQVMVAALLGLARPRSPAASCTANAAATATSPSCHPRPRLQPLSKLATARGCPPRPPPALGPLLDLGPVRWQRMLACSTGCWGARLDREEPGQTAPGGTNPFVVRRVDIVESKVRCGLMPSWCWKADPEKDRTCGRQSLSGIE